MADFLNNDLCNAETRFRMDCMSGQTLLVSLKSKIGAVFGLAALLTVTTGYPLAAQNSPDFVVGNNAQTGQPQRPQPSQAPRFNPQQKPAGIMLDAGRGVELVASAPVKREVPGGLVLFPGDRIRTGPDGSARLILQGGFEVMIGGESQVLVNGALHDEAKQLAGLMVTFGNGVYRLVGAGRSPQDQQAAELELERGAVVLPGEPGFACLIARPRQKAEPILALDFPLEIRGDAPPAQVECRGKVDPAQPQTAGLLSRIPRIVLADLQPAPGQQTVSPTPPAPVEREPQPRGVAAVVPSTNGQAPAGGQDRGGLRADDLIAPPSSAPPPTSDQASEAQAPGARPSADWVSEGGRAPSPPNVAPPNAAQTDSGAASATGQSAGVPVFRVPAANRQVARSGDASTSVPVSTQAALERAQALLRQSRAVGARPATEPPPPPLTQQAQTTVQRSPTTSLPLVRRETSVAPPPLIPSTTSGTANPSVAALGQQSAETRLRPPPAFETVPEDLPPWRPPQPAGVQEPSAIGNGNTGAPQSNSLQPLGGLSLGAVTSPTATAPEQTQPNSQSQQTVQTAAQTSGQTNSQPVPPRPQQAAVAPSPVADPVQPRASTRRTNGAGGAFRVQVGAYRNAKYARAAANELKARGYNVDVVPGPTDAGGPWTRLRFGQYPSRQAAEEAARAFKRSVGRNAIAVRG